MTPGGFRCRFLRRSGPRRGSGQRLEVPSHGRGHWFDPSIAHPFRPARTARKGWVGRRARGRQGPTAGPGRAWRLGVCGLILAAGVTAMGWLGYGPPKPPHRLPLAPIVVPEAPPASAVVFR